VSVEDPVKMSFTSAVRRAAQVNAEGVALRDEGATTTWRELAQRVARLAGGLRRLGVRDGERVAVLALNSPLYFELVMAVWWAGGVLVPLNKRLAAPEIAQIVDDADATLLIADEAMAPLAAECGAGAGGRTPLVLDVGTMAWLLQAEAIAEAGQGVDALAAIFYTGGTTGLPKGVELTHRNFLFGAMGMLRDLALAPDSVYLHAAPMFHVADFGIGLGVTLAAGGHSFMARFSPEQFYEKLRTEHVTHVQLVPTMLAMVLDAPCRDDALLARIQRISYGAAPITQPLLARALDAFPNARLHQFYGMTEVCGASVMLEPERHVLDGPLAGKLAAAGRVLPGFELRIADPTGAALGSGQTGEIQMKGPAVMRGYWRRPEETREAFVDGWLRSGDAGYLDEDGYVYVVDRLKDMIISGGENIYCTEVENVLASHPAVQAAAVVGLPDATWGERVHAAIVLQPGACVTPEALDAHCRRHIPGYKVPRGYAFVPALPVSGVGKVQKHELKRQLLARGTSTS
jgi:long-chain acyl-CoA synthetase